MGGVGGELTQEREVERRQLTAERRVAVEGDEKSREHKGVTTRRRAHAEQRQADTMRHRGDPTNTRDLSRINREYTVLPVTLAGSVRKYSITIESFRNPQLPALG